VTREAGDFLAPLLLNLAERLTTNTREGRCAQGLHLLSPGQERCEVCPAPSLRCPACTSRLMPLQTHGQTVDFCTRCPGLWLDANELAALRSAHSGPLAARAGVHGFAMERSEVPGMSVAGTAGNAAMEGALSWLLHAIGGLF
jgi:hypothetical protein